MYESTMIDRSDDLSWCYISPFKHCNILNLNFLIVDPNQLVDPSLQYADPNTYVDPNTGYVDPNAAYVDPNTGFVDPNAGFVDPNAGFVDPNAAYVDPNIQYVDPSTGYVDPNSGYVDPNAQFVDPNTGFIDPNAAYTQGSQFVGMEAGVAADPAFPGQQGGVEVQHPAFTDPAQQAAYQQYQVLETDLFSSIPCSTKYFRRFFQISVCRNLETKGKVFWK